MKKILLIDDNLEMRENTSEILRLANYQVITAENGKEGVKQALNEIPDLIICDIMMPELDGYGVLHLLSQNPVTSEIPFIFLTAKTEKEDFRKGMVMGADDYLVKPFDDLDLLKSVEVRLKKKEHFSLPITRNIHGFNEFIESDNEVAQLNLLTTGRKTHTFKKKAIIYFEGEEAKYVIFIVSGNIKTYKMNEAGKEFITGFHKAGEFIGSIDLLESQKFKESAAALDDSEVVLIPKTDFYSLLYTNPAISFRFIHLLSNDKSEIEERILNIAFNSVRKRVANILLKLASPSGKPENNSIINMSRSNLAGIIGIAPETISRTLSDFKEEKLISIDNTKIKILDLQKLSTMKD